MLALKEIISTLHQSINIVLCILKDILENFYNSKIFPSLASGAIGAVITSFVNYKINIKPVKTRSKKIEMENFFTPLLKQYYKITKREQANIGKLISDIMFINIDKIFEENSYWYFIDDKNIKNILIRIKECSSSRNIEKTKNEFDNLYNYLKK